MKTKELIRKYTDKARLQKVLEIKRLRARGYTWREIKSKTGYSHEECRRVYNQSIALDKKKK
jgi:hypothetical protein